MGTRFKMILYAVNAETARQAADAAFARIAQLDNIMSDYRETSELMRLSQQAGQAPVRVSDDLFRILVKSQEVAQQTQGAFDVTVGPLVQLWRRARRTREMPDPERLAEAQALTGYRMLHLDEKAQTVRLDKRGMRLDLGGIAKGYAADVALAILKQRGIGQALVAGGGDIAVSEPPPGLPGWTIGIAPLEAPDRPPPRRLRLVNAAVSTSGDAEQHVEIGGIRYAHIIDPKTGMGLMGQRSVTVVAANGTTADALATAVCVLGPERGLKVIGAVDGAAALFVEATPRGERTFESARWKAIPRE